MEKMASTLAQYELLIVKNEGADAIKYQIKDQDRLFVGTHIDCRVRIVSDRIRPKHFEIYDNSNGKVRIAYFDRLLRDSQLACFTEQIKLCNYGDDDSVKINDEPLKENEKREIKSGDIIQLLDKKFRWESKSDSTR